MMFIEKDTFAIPVFSEKWGLHETKINKILSHETHCRFYSVLKTL